MEFGPEQKSYFQCFKDKIDKAFGNCNEEKESLYQNYNQKQQDYVQKIREQERLLDERMKEICDMVEYMKDQE